MNKVKKHIVECLRCGEKWKPRTQLPKLPRQCVRCKRMDWNVKK